MEFGGLGGNWGKLREVWGNWEECYTRGEVAPASFGHLGQIKLRWGGAFSDNYRLELPHGYSRIVLGVLGLC